MGSRNSGICSLENEIFYFDKLKEKKRFSCTDLRSTKKNK